MLYIYTLLSYVCRMSSTYGNLPACTIFFNHVKHGFPRTSRMRPRRVCSLERICRCNWMAQSRDFARAWVAWLNLALTIPSLTPINLWVCLKSTFHWMSLGVDLRIRSFFCMIFIDFLYFSITSYPISHYFCESWSHGDPRNRSAQMGIWRFPKF
jgi:hypothetical protein